MGTPTLAPTAAPTLACHEFFDKTLCATRSDCMWDSVVGCIEGGENVTRHPTFAPTVAPTPTAAPTVPTTSPTNQTVVPESGDDESEDSAEWWWILVLIAFILLFLICGAIALKRWMRKRQAREEAPKPAAAPEPVVAAQEPEPPPEEVEPEECPWTEPKLPLAVSATVVDLAPPEDSKPQVPLPKERDIDIRIGRDYYCHTGGSWDASHVLQPQSAFGPLPSQVFSTPGGSASFACTQVPGEQGRTIVSSNLACCSSGVGAVDPANHQSIDLVEVYVSQDARADTVVGVHTHQALTHRGYYA